MNPWLLLLGLVGSRRLRRWLTLLAMGLAASFSASAQESACNVLERLSVSGQLLYVTSSQNERAFKHDLAQDNF